MADMQIENWPLEKLIPYARNPRKNDQAVEQIAAAIKEFGFRVPVIAKSDGTIVDGHLRLKAAQKLKMDTVPVINADDMTEAQIKAFRISVNRMAELAEWDFDLLKIELEELKDMNFDLELTGLGQEMIDDLLNAVEGTEGETDPDEVPEVPAEPVIRPGDLYLLGRHRLLCGDSTNITDVERLMDGKKADMVFTDPPYGINYSGGRSEVVATKEYGKIKNDTLEGNDLGNLISLVFMFIKADADVYICVFPLRQKPFLDFIEHAGKEVDAVIVWDKGVPGLGYMAYRRQCEFILFVKGGQFEKGDCSDFDLWQISKDNAQTYIHGTQKPVGMSARAINNSSKSGDTILDLFLGSGSTLIACEKTGRVCYGMEIDPHYCDVIVKRWENFTGKKATLQPHPHPNPPLEREGI